MCKSTVKNTKKLLQSIDIQLYITRMNMNKTKLVKKLMD